MSSSAPLPLSVDQIADAIEHRKGKHLLLENLSKRFGSLIALERMRLEIEPGELVSLLEPSGCGKTTTLRLIAGFEFPETGSILVDGEDISMLPPNKRGLGMVFQSYSLFPHLNVYENIEFGLRMARVSHPERLRRTQNMLTTIRLPEHGHRRISDFSGGQQQRVALGRALISNPAVLLLDEPLGALDKNLREGMQREVRRLQRDLGITTVMVTRDQKEALTVSDRMVVMNWHRRTGKLALRMRCSTRRLTGMSNMTRRLNLALRPTILPSGSISTTWRKIRRSGSKCGTSRLRDKTDSRSKRRYGIANWC